MKEELGIYIHIPFCRQRCYYCDFISYVKQEEWQKKYMDKIVQELEQYREIISSYEVTTIYIGGGTPSNIDSKEIKRILEKIYSMTLGGNAKEITIEVNPGTVTLSKLQDYQSCGVNRISIGLQTTNNLLLKEIGRIHTWEQFLETYQLVKQVGIKNINIDLMIGLPKQTIQDLKKSLENVIALDPEHVSVYSLILEEGTKLEEMVSSGKLKLPEEELERQMYWYVKNTLALAGYEHYEISNFAKRGRESLHNLNCWKQKQYLGVGLAAHSYLAQKRFSNPEDFNQYIDTEDFREIKKIQEIQNKLEQEKEYMLLGLRKIQGIKISEFKQKFGDNPIYLFREELQYLVKEKLIDLDLDEIKLTNKGLDLANMVWEEFV